MITLAVLLAALAPLPADSASSSGLASHVREWRRVHEREVLREFMALLSLPNQASDAAAIERNAAAIAAALARRGLQVELLRAEGAPPLVVGEWHVPGVRRTVSFYAHYDGQPTDPAGWHGDPWVPVLRDRPIEAGGRIVDWERTVGSLDPEIRLYARSAGDDKAAVVALLAGLDALHALGRQPTVNLKFVFEGEEEAGSPHLPALLERHAERLATDAWVLCDGPVHQTREPLLALGARGSTGAEITVYGPNRTLHSGHYGNWAPNPIVLLTHLLDSMRDADGRILIPGFLDAVRPLAPTERAALAAAPKVDDILRRELGLAATEDGGAPLLERLQLPALNVRGIAGGGVGASACNAIPTEATASIDFRLVPDQTVEGVRDLVERHMAARGFHVTHEHPSEAIRLAHAHVVRVDWEAGGYPAARTPLDGADAFPGTAGGEPFVRSVLAALERAHGGPVVVIPMLGGSIPVHLFQGKARLPVVIVPIANHDDNQHAADENLRLQNLWDGIEAFAELYAGL